jgi:hypothetical protein
MKKITPFVLVIFLTLSFACQALAPQTSPPRDGIVITNCAEVVHGMRGMQTNDIPQTLYETGIKQGDEFDINDYFQVLPNLSMQQGYTLDYVLIPDSLGSFPLIAARPTDQAAYSTEADIKEQGVRDYWKYVEINDVEQGYFEFTTFYILSSEFYLVWHANYHDAEVVCDREAVDAIVAERETGDFGASFDKEQMKQIKALQNIEPLVKLTGTNAVVEVIIFSKWGGFYRMTYTISRSFPHEILDIQQENLVPYDCGILF